MEKNYLYILYTYKNIVFKKNRSSQQWLDDFLRSNIREKIIYILITSMNKI